MPKSNQTDSHIRKIEDALDIVLEKEDNTKKYQNSYYNYYKDIRGLTLCNLEFKNFNALLSLSQSLEYLTLVDCVVEELSGLSQLKRLRNLTLDGCNLNGAYGPEVQEEDTFHHNFQSVEIKNMELKHLTVLRPISQNIHYLEFSNCQIQNLYEINLFSSIYRMTFNACKITFSAKDIIYKASVDKWIGSMTFCNMQLNKLHKILPITKGMKSLTLQNVTVDSLECINSMPKFSLICIDSATTVKSRVIPTLQSNSHKKVECEILEAKKDIDPEEKQKFDLEKLASIAPYIQKLSLDHARLKNIQFSGSFPQLKELEFAAIEVNLKQFLPLAHQIQKFKLEGTKLKNLKYLQDYTQLTELETNERNIDGKIKRPLKNLKRLLPLKKQLKKLIIWEDNLKGVEYLEEFTSLESLRMIDSISGKTAKITFNLPSLKKLNISVHAKNGSTFNLNNLTQLEGLAIYSSKKITLSGLEHLTKLKHLDLEGDRLKIIGINQLQKLEYFGCNAATNINKIKEIKSLKILELDIDWNFKIKGLEQFPNLEKLSISGGDKTSTLGYLPKLKVLCPGTSEKSKDMYKGLPNLEELDLDYNYMKELPDFSNLKKLKVLNLSENHDLVNIEEMRHLKSLEQVNFYDTNISDISVLNGLEHLYEVNLCGIGISFEEARKQLDKPEIAVYLGRPAVPFIIWRRVSLEM